MSSRLAGLAPILAFALARVSPAGGAGTTEEQRLSHAFGGGAADAELVLLRIHGQVRLGGRSGTSLIDLADYSRAGSLTLRRDVTAGPTPSGSALVPAGTYGIDLVPQSSDGLPVLVLSGADGLRLRLALASAPRPAAPVDRLGVEGISPPSEAAWSLAFHFPTASALLVLEPPGGRLPPPAAVSKEGEQAPGEGPPRRRSRAEVIQEKLEARQGAPGRAPRQPRGPRRRQ